MLCLIILEFICITLCFSSDKYCYNGRHFFNQPDNIPRMSSFTLCIFVSKKKKRNQHSHYDQVFYPHSHSNVIWQKADFMMEIICINRKNPLQTLQASGLKTEPLQLSTMWELLLEGMAFQIWATIFINPARNTLVNLFLNVSVLLQHSPKFQQM